MFSIKTEKSFDSAHFLKGYNGKCSNIHGHRWRVIVEVQSDKLILNGEKEGMVVDFGDIKQDLKQLLDIYDHSLIIQKGSLRTETLNCLKEDNFKIVEVVFRPTAEMFSYHFYKELEALGYNLKRVEVFETPTNSATYE